MKKKNTRLSSLKDDLTGKCAFFSTVCMKSNEVYDIENFSKICFTSCEQFSYTLLTHSENKYVFSSNVFLNQEFGEKQMFDGQKMQEKQ